MPIPALLVVTLCVAAAGVHGSSYPTEVVDLTDATFEHDTQAASGQTTGVWAVLFIDSAAKRHDRASLVVTELAQDEDKELIYAQLDVARNLKVARRFSDVVFPPCILLFRDRQMYLFDQSFDRNDILEQVREFVTSGYANANPLDVPELNERTLNLEAFDAGNKVDMKVVGVGVLMIVGGLLFQTWAILNKDKFKPEPGSEPAASAPAGAGADAAPVGAGANAAPAGAGADAAPASAGAKPSTPAPVGGNRPGASPGGKGKSKGKSS